MKDEQDSTGDPRREQIGWRTVPNRVFGHHEEITVVERARSGQGGSEGTWK